jgi:hypothetical protein
MIKKALRGVMMTKLILVLAFILTTYSSQSYAHLTLDNHSHTPNLINLSDLTKIDSFLNLFAAASSGDGGGWSGNGGGGDRDDSDNVWFIGDQTIKYCVVKDKSYPVSDQDLIKMIDSGVQKWLDFFQKYNLLNNDFAFGYDFKRLNNITFHDDLNRGLSKDFVLTNDCNDARLQFLFGVENSVIQEFKKFSSAEHAYGLAIRESFDHVIFNHKGFVWVDSFSKDSKEIDHILLHEIGHVFGMKHDSVPVMDERLTSFVGKKRKFSTDYLGKIESDSWKYGLLDGHEIVMSSTKGARFRNRAARRQQNNNCADLSYSPNKEIPRPIRHALGFSRGGCFKLTVTYHDNLNPFAPANRNGRMRRQNKKPKHFTLKLEEYGRGFPSQMSGSFTANNGRRPELSGPSIVTSGIKKVNSNVGRPINKRVHFKRKLSLDKSPQLDSLTGTFKDLNTTYPAKIEFNRGMVIEIFVPQADKWWTLKTRYNQN